MFIVLSYGLRFLAIAGTTIPKAVRQIPATKLGHGLTLGAVAVMKNEATASRMPATMQTQANTLIKGAGSETARVPSPLPIA